MLRGAETPLTKRRRNRQAAGRREDSGEARGVAGAQALSVSEAPGSTRQDGWKAPRARIQESRLLEAHQAGGFCPARSDPLGLPPPLGCFLRPPSRKALPGPRGEHRLFRRAEPAGREPRPEAGRLGGPSRLRLQFSPSLGASWGFSRRPFRQLPDFRSEERDGVPS